MICVYVGIPASLTTGCGSLYAHSFGKDLPDLMVFVNGIVQDAILDELPHFKFKAAFCVILVRGAGPHPGIIANQIRGGRRHPWDYSTEHLDLVQAKVQIAGRTEAPSGPLHCFQALLL